MSLCSCFSTGKPGAHFRIPSSAADASGTRCLPAQRKPGPLGTPPGASAHSTGRFSFQLKVPCLTSQVPEDPECSQAGFRLAPGDTGHLRLDCCRRARPMLMSAALACGRTRRSSKVQQLWAGRDPSDRPCALSLGKPAPTCRDHSETEPRARAAWKGNSGTWHISGILTPSRDLPASTEGGDTERSAYGEREREVGRNWSRRRLFLFFATAACISLTN